MNWYLAVLKNYVGFSGRAGRTEYWMFTLFYAIVFLVLLILTAITRSVFIDILLLLYVLGTIVPGLAVAWRRMQDTGHHGALSLLSFVPFGGIVVLVFMILPGTPGPNEFGPEPSSIPAEA